MTRQRSDFNFDFPKSNGNSPKGQSVMLGITISVWKLHEDLAKLLQDRIIPATGAYLPILHLKRSRCSPSVACFCGEFRRSIREIGPETKNHISVARFSSGEGMAQALMPGKTE
jgi:hypothetical protein